MGGLDHIAGSDVYRKTLAPKKLCCSFHFCSAENDGGQHRFFLAIIELEKVPNLPRFSENKQFFLMSEIHSSILQGKRHRLGRADAILPGFLPSPLGKRIRNQEPD